MPCLAVILVLAFPRVALAAMMFFTDYISRAYEGLLLPLLGLVFLPLTTIVYAWIVNSNHTLEGRWVLVLILAVLIDAGSFGGASRRRA
jgi:hypothetical protein